MELRDLCTSPYCEINYLSAGRVEKDKFVYKYGSEMTCGKKYLRRSRKRRKESIKMNFKDV